MSLHLRLTSDVKGVVHSPMPQTRKPGPSYSAELLPLFLDQPLNEWAMLLIWQILASPKRSSVQTRDLTEGYVDRAMMIAVEGERLNLGSMQA